MLPIACRLSRKVNEQKHQNFTTQSYEGDGSYTKKNAPKKEFYLLKILQITP